MITLWVCSLYLIHSGRLLTVSLMTALPATFMSAVSMTYILMAEEGLKLPGSVSCPIGLIFACACLTAYYLAVRHMKKKNPSLT